APAHQVPPQQQVQPQQKGMELPNGPPEPKPTPSQPTNHESDIQWLMQNVDGTISHDQWLAWINMGFYNPATKKFKSENVDANGQPIQGEFEKPTDCPSGTTKFG